MPRRRQRNAVDDFLERHGGRTVALYAVLVIAIVTEILSSPAARVWFGLLIVGSVAVAVFLRSKGRDL